MINIAICDDNIFTTTQIENLITSFFANKEISYKIDVYFDGSTLLQKYCPSNIYDLVFLDIEMYVDGITVARKMREMSNDTVIIFISAYTSYCQELFEVEPLRFIQKPIDETKFNQYLKLALEKIVAENKTYTFMFKHKLFSISIKDIIYFESRLHTIIIHTINGDMYQSGKLNDVEDKFKNGKFKFLRIHQSFFINLHFVQYMSFSEVTLYNGMCLKISENRRKVVREQYMQIMENL